MQHEKNPFFIPVHTVRIQTIVSLNSNSPDTHQHIDISVISFSQFNARQNTGNSPDFCFPVLHTLARMMIQYFLCIMAGVGSMLHIIRIRKILYIPDKNTENIFVLLILHIPVATQRILHILRMTLRIFGFGQKMETSLFYG